MITISGIKHQDKLEKLPYFNKQTAAVLIGKEGWNLDKKISQLRKKGYLINLKKGLYVTSVYLNSQVGKIAYCRYAANILRYPSYLSLEYVLSENNLIPEAIYVWTNVTTKSSRQYKNNLGSFIYKSIKESLFTGYTNKKVGEFKIAIASPAKALFDYLYLKNNLGADLELELREGLRINWLNFSNSDLRELERYVILSRSQKMERMLKIIRNVNKR